VLPGGTAADRQRQMDHQVGTSYSVPTAGAGQRDPPSAAERSAWARAGDAPSGARTRRRAARTSDTLRTGQPPRSAGRSWGDRPDRFRQRSAGAVVTRLSPGMPEFLSASVPRSFTWTAGVRSPHGSLPADERYHQIRAARPGRTPRSSPAFTGWLPSGQSLKDSSHIRDESFRDAPKRRSKTSLGGAGSGRVLDAAEPAATRSVLSIPAGVARAGMMGQWRPA
jgi:hypothetical protein